MLLLVFRDSALEAIVLVLARRLVDWFDEWEARLVSQGCCLAQPICSHRRWSPKDDWPEVCPGLPSFVVAGVPVRDVCGLPRGRGVLASLSSVHCFRGRPLASSLRGFFHWSLFSLGLSTCSEDEEAPCRLGHLALTSLFRSKLKSGLSSGWLSNMSCICSLVSCGNHDNAIIRRVITKC